MAVKSKPPALRVVVDSGVNLPLDANAAMGFAIGVKKVKSCCIIYIK
jgi:hypothetical protein